MIRFDHVSYAFTSDKSKSVIDDISLTVGKGEELAVMGSNGCGKTTLGLLLCGVLKPDSGTVSIGGMNSGSGDDKPAIGFLFQDPDNGLVATTVEREIAFSLENRNMPPAEMQEIVGRIIDMFEMKQLSRRLVWDLSGGEKQRLSLAGVFASGPKILFLDEPASYLDHPGAINLDTALREVRRVNPDLTIIRITQYAQVADNFHRVIIMGEGKILADGRPKEIFSNQGLMNQSGIRPPLKYLTPMPKQKEESPAIIDAPSARPLLATLDNLSFAYEDDQPVLDCVSLEILRGESIGLVGPSGCGKSTLAQIICKIYKPNTGAVSFADDGCRAVMSFQQPERQFFLDTCYDEIVYSIKDKYESDTLIEIAARKFMGIVGLDFDTFRSRDPHTLSGGEARRLGFAIVVALDADLLVFDEPTCGLDEFGLQAFKKMLNNLKDAGKTVMIISHNSDVIADLSDRVALLVDGKIVSVQPPLAFFTSDSHKGILSIPDIIDYQQEVYNNATTTHPEDVFDLGHF